VGYRHYHPGGHPHIPGLGRYEGYGKAVEAGGLPVLLKRKPSIKMAIEPYFFISSLPVDEE
jgi:hypothetical protein